MFGARDRDWVAFCALYDRHGLSEAHVPRRSAGKYEVRWRIRQILLPAQRFMWLIAVSATASPARRTFLPRGRACFQCRRNSSILMKWLPTILWARLTGR